MFMDTQYPTGMGISIYHRTMKGGYEVEQLGFNSFVKAVFDGYREAKSYSHNPFEDLNRTYDCWIGTAGTALYDVEDLNKLVDQAKTKEQYEAILEHLYRHDATRVDCYKKIEKKIINKMW
jgi:hypothetical protein